MSTLTPERIFPSSLPVIPLMTTLRILYLEFNDTILHLLILPLAVHTPMFLQSIEFIPWVLRSTSCTAGEIRTPTEQILSLLPSSSWATAAYISFCIIPYYWGWILKYSFILRITLNLLLYSRRDSNPRFHLERVTTSTASMDGSIIY